MQYHLVGRDRQVVQAIARFGRLTSSQVHQLVFADNASRTPTDRSLKRLTDRDFLIRRERRILLGSTGGSAHYVYQLGRLGRSLFGNDDMSRRTDVLHSLAIADVYVALKQLERSQVLVLEGWTTEPDSWENVNGEELKPDMRVDLKTAQGAAMKLWVECDLATEGKRQIKDKLVRYWNAVAGSDEFADYGVLWVACDQTRADELAWIIADGKNEEAKALFTVTTINGLPNLFKPVDN